MKDMITIAIDLGHSETAAGMAQKSAVSGEYKVVELNLDEFLNKVIWTQIMITEDQLRKLKGHTEPDYSYLETLEDFQIGTKLDAYIKEGELFPYFKVKPELFEKECGGSAAAVESEVTHATIIACYAYQLVKNIFKYNTHDVRSAYRPGTFRLIVGCPSTADWTSGAAREKYAALIKRATGAAEVSIIPESRGAMFSTIESVGSKVSTKDGAVVFDFGSSTADCTYMLLGRKEFDFSWTLGAHEIEMNMLKDAYGKAMEENGDFELSTLSTVANSNMLRDCKEKYYSGAFAAKKNGHPVFCTFIKDDKDYDQAIDTPVRINDAFMDQASSALPLNITCDSDDVRYGSWTELCKQFFEEAKKRINNLTYTDPQGNVCNCDFTTAVLTGGASRMPFIYDICRKVFPDKNIILEKIPSLTVSNGLVWVAITDDAMEKCISDTVAQLDENSRVNLTSLRNGILDSVMSVIDEMIQENVTKWQNASTDMSLDDLKQMVSAAMEQNSFRQKVDAMVGAAIDNWKKILSEKMVEEINGQVAKIYSDEVSKGLVIPNDVWAGMSQDVIDSDFILSIKSIIEKRLYTRIESAFGGLLGAIMNWILSLFGLKRQPSDSLSSSDRLRQGNKIVESVSSIRGDAGDEIDRIFSQRKSGYDESMKKNVRVAFEIITLMRFSIEG